MSNSREVRFWNRVNKGDGCWAWTGCRLPKGYGRLKFANVFWLAHRLSYTLAVGPIPDGHEVCHTCDNPSCVRPDHLFAGTHSDNMRDCAAKGRVSVRRAEKNPNSKLTLEMAQEIRRLREQGMTHQELATRFKVSKGTIWPILKGTGWKDATS